MTGDEWYEARDKRLAENAFRDESAREKESPTIQKLRAEITDLIAELRKDRERLEKMLALGLTVSPCGKKWTAHSWKPIYLIPGTGESPRAAIDATRLYAPVTPEAKR